jgi:protein-tyrosine phosphatase
VLDLHCHILPGLDDGPTRIEDSLEMARVAASDGVTRMVATPHIRDDYPFDFRRLPEHVERLNLALAGAGIAVEVLSGGEVSLTKTAALDDDDLRALCLGSSSYLLVESPYTHATDLLEHNLFDLQLRGFRPVLAHPERSPSLMSDRRRLEELVGHGIACSVTAASITGGFGRTVREFAYEAVRAGLIHDMASDAHDSKRRPPRLSEAVAELGGGADGVAAWLTEEAPEAILADASPLPPPPQRGARAKSRLRLRRSRG